MPELWVDRCVCKHVKDGHEIVLNAGKVSVGGCPCGCPRFVLAAASELPAPVAVAPREVAPPNRGQVPDG